MLCITIRSGTLLWRSFLGLWSRVPPIHRWQADHVQIVDIAQLSSHLPTLPAKPRIVASGNFAPPLIVLGVLDSTLPEFTLNMLLGQKGIPDREGVTLETSFVGPGMRKSPRLSYVPSRLSLVPMLFKTTLPPDLVVIHTTVPQNGKVSLGIETNVMVGAIEAVRAASNWLSVRPCASKACGSGMTSKVRT